KRFEDLAVVIGPANAFSSGLVENDNVLPGHAALGAVMLGERHRLTGVFVDDRENLLWLKGESRGGKEQESEHQQATAHGAFPGWRWQARRIAGSILPAQSAASPPRP